jgi:hypothetical protein
MKQRKNFDQSFNVFQLYRKTRNLNRSLSFKIASLQKI